MKVNIDSFKNSSIQEKSLSFTSIICYPETNYRMFKGSFQLLAWISIYSSLRNHSRIVALEIASYYNKNLAYCYPNYEAIAEKTGLSHSSISRAIKEIKLSGEWIVIHTPVKNKVRTISSRYYPLSPLEGDKINKLGEWIPSHKHKTITEYKQFIKINNFERKLINNGK